jgi:hypothetical protein
MIARQLLIGAIALTTLPLPSLWPAPQTEPPPSRTLLHEESLSKDITSLRVMEQLNNPHYKKDIIYVTLVGGSVPDADCVRYGVPGAQNVCGQYLANPPKFPRPLKDLAIQVWLLRRDGMTLTQTSKSDGGLSNAGSITDMMSFLFEHVAPKELAGVVVRVDGMLFVREIKSDQ